MRLTVRLLGVEVFHVTTDADVEETEAGDTTSNAVGFVRSSGDQRWLETPAPELE